MVTEKDNIEDQLLLNKPEVHVSKPLSRRNKNSTLTSKSQYSGIRNQAETNGYKKCRQLRRPSTAKLDQIFNFDFTISPTVKPQQHSASQVIKNEKKTYCARQNVQFNRFGFKNPYTNSTSKRKHHATPCITSSNTSRSKHFASGNVGLNINLDESLPVKSGACMSSAQLCHKSMTKQKLKVPRIHWRDKSCQSTSCGTENSTMLHSRGKGRFDKSLLAKRDNQDKDSPANDKVKAEKLCRSSSADLKPTQIDVATSLKMSEGNDELPEERSENMKACLQEISRNIPEDTFSLASKSAKEVLDENEASYDSILYTESAQNYIQREIASDFSDTELHEDDSRERASPSSKNLSTCSLTSGDYETSCTEMNMKGIKLCQPIPSKTTILSSCCDVGCPSLWSSNRSYFLRVTENRRKQHRKEWEQKQSKLSFVAIPPALHRDKAVQEIENELAATKHKMKLQEREIHYLRKKIYMVREEKMLKREKRQLVDIENNTHHTSHLKTVKALLPCEVPQYIDERGHGDETDESLVVEVCNSIPARASKSCEQESLPNEAGDITTHIAPKEYDQGYYSLPRRSESYVVSSPKLLPRGLLTPTLSNESLLFYRNSITGFSDSSIFSSLSPPNENCESVGCQTDLMLFSGSSDEMNNTLILLQSYQDPNNAVVIEPIIEENDLVTGFLLNVMPHMLVLAALWRNSHGHIIDLHLVLRRYVFPAFRRWFN